MDTTTLDKLFNLININDLFDFLKKYAKKHPDFQKELETYMKKECIEPGNSKVFDCRQEVMGALDESICESRYGEWFSLGEFESRLDEIFESAENLMEMGNPEAALATGVQALETLGDAFDEYQPDDSYGYASIIYDHALNLIFAAAKHPAIDRETVEEYVEEIEEDEDIDTLFEYGFDSKDNLIMRLSLLTKTAEERIPLLDKTIKSGKHDHDLHTFVEQKIKDLRELGRDNEAEKTIRKHITLPEIRKIAVDAAEAKKDYAEAVSLVEEGIAIARNERHYGNERDWMKRLQMLYKAMGDKEKEIEATTDLFVKEYFSKEYYQQLKSLVPPSKWKAFLFNLIDNCEDAERHTDAIANIYIAEKEWERLYQLVVKGNHTRISDLDKYAAYLRGKHSSEILELYDSKLRWYAENNLGRESYESIVRSMRIMQQLEGGKESAHNLAEYFRQTYKKRRAMMELISGF